MRVAVPAEAETFEPYVDVFDKFPGGCAFPGGRTNFSRAAHAEPAVDESLVGLAEELMATGGCESTSKERGTGRRWFTRS